MRVVLELCGGGIANFLAPKERIMSDWEDS